MHSHRRRVSIDVASNREKLDSRCFAYGTSNRAKSDVTFARFSFERRSLIVIGPRAVPVVRSFRLFHSPRFMYISFSVRTYVSFLSED